MDELRSDRLVDGVALDNLTAGDGDDDLNGNRALPGTCIVNSFLCTGLIA